MVGIQDSPSGIKSTARDYKDRTDVMPEIAADTWLVVRFLEIQYNGVWYAYHSDISASEMQGAAASNIRHGAHAEDSHI
jgi:hypothetical protein